MKTFAVKEKRSAPAIVRRRPYVHTPLGPVQRAQQAAIHNILRSTGAQAKLTIGQPNDIYEQEADRVADQVMAMPDPGLQRQPENEEEEETLRTKPLADQITPLVQRQEETPVEEEEPEMVQAKRADESIVLRQEDEEKENEEEAWLEALPDEEEQLQAKINGSKLGSVSPSVESGIQSLRGCGQPLSALSRAYFEPRFGADFSGIRVHTDANANHLTRSLNAKAFTLGCDVVFGTGQYSPETFSGKRLMAHELTHVLQQSCPIQKKQDRQSLFQLPKSLLITSNQTNDRATKTQQQKLETPLFLPQDKQVVLRTATTNAARQRYEERMRDHVYAKHERNCQALRDFVNDFGNKYSNINAKTSHQRKLKKVATRIYSGPRKILVVPTTDTHDSAQRARDAGEGRHKRAIFPDPYYSGAVSYKSTMNKNCHYWGYYFSNYAADGGGIDRTKMLKNVYFRLSMQDAESKRFKDGLNVIWINNAASIGRYRMRQLLIHETQHATDEHWKEKGYIDVITYKSEYRAYWSDGRFNKYSARPARVRRRIKGELITFSSLRQYMIFRQIYRYPFCKAAWHYNNIKNRIRFRREVLKYSTPDKLL